MSIYKNAIMKAAKVDEKEAFLIERVMRDWMGTLDSLDNKAFNALARKAKKILADPETRKLYQY